MLVYRFEQYVDEYLGDNKFKKRWDGIFGGGHVSYPDDANYQTYGCTLWQYKDSNYRFACSTIDKLIEYFGSDFAKLIDKKGVRLVEYEVKRQDCFFSSKHIELVFRADKVISKRRII